MAVAASSARYSSVLRPVSFSTSRRRTASESRAASRADSSLASSLSASFSDVTAVLDAVAALVASSSSVRIRELSAFDAASSCRHQCSPSPLNSARSPTPPPRPPRTSLACARTSSSSSSASALADAIPSIANRSLPERFCTARSCADA